MTARRWLLLALVAAALLLVVGRVGGALYVDYSWYASMGAESVWRTMLLDTLLLRGVTALLGTAFVFANLYSVRHSIVSLVLPRRVGDLEIGEEVPGRTLMIGVLLLSAALGALLTLPYGDWTLLAQAWRGLPYEELDPYHQVDLGFYVHWLPLETALYHWALLVLLVVSIVVVALYALTPSLRWDRGTLRVTNYVRRHLVVLGSIALALLAWSYRLDEYRLLVVGSGPDGMFDWADHHVRLTANAVLAALSLVIGGLVLLTGWMGQMRRAFVGVTIVLVASVVLRQAWPAVQERTRAPREPASREAPYESTRAIYSRRAVGLESFLPADSVPRALPTVAALSAWDARALALGIVREHRGTEMVGDVGWRVAETGLEALVVVRPASDVAPDPSASWSLVRAAAGAVADGQPDDVDRPLRAPLAYPGARGWQLLDDPQDSIPGARLTSALSRWAHAWGEQNSRFLDEDFGEPGNKLVLRRDVRERVGALAPFFAQGDQVWPVVGADGLYWVMHLYAATDWYPLAIPMGNGEREWRSSRLAATALVHAASGRVRLVPATGRDALAETWTRMFPELFTPADSLPAGLAEQLPPDVDGVRARAEVLARAGRRQDTQPVQRTLPRGDGDSVVAAPFTPFATPRGVAVAVPLLDPTGVVSGTVVAVGGRTASTGWIPTTGGGPTWDATRERLLRGADSVSLGAGARLVTGAVRLVPLASGEALLMTHYRWRGDAPPEVLRVATVIGDSARAAPTLAGALGLVPAVPGPDSTALVTGDMPGRAGALYDRMRDALRRGDWKEFGDAFDALGRALGRGARP